MERSETQPNAAGEDAGVKNIMTLQDMENKIAVMQNHIEDLLDRNSKANSEIDSLTATLKNRDATVALHNQLKIEMTRQIALMDHQLASKTAEIDQVHAEMSQLRHQLKEANNARHVAVMRLDDLSAREEVLANSKRIHAQEMESLKNQKRILVEELQKAEAELTSMISRTREGELESQIQQMKMELISSDGTISGLKNLLVQEQARVQVLIEQLDSTKASEKSLREIHVREMEAQLRVVQLCQEESREAKTAAEKLSAALAEMQMALRNASEKQRELEMNTERDKAELKAQLLLKDQSIDSLKHELSEANALLEKTKQDAIETFVEQMFPDAVNLGRHLPSDMTLSKIFMQYASATKELDNIKDERDQLLLRLSFFNNELAERESEVNTTRAALNEVQQENQKLQIELRHLESDCQEAQTVAQEAVRSASQHGKDKVRLQSQVDDLSAQVVHLVNDLEALKQGQSSAPLRTYPSDSPATERLLLFSSVSELQHRNIELLAALRDMQERAERAEHLFSDSQDVGELQSRLEETKEEVSRLQNSSLNQEHLIGILVRQRDHFEKLAKKPETKDMCVATVPLSSQVSGKPQPPQQSQQQQQQQPSVRPPGPGFGGPPFVVELRTKLRKAEEALANVNKDYDMFRQDSRNQFNMVTEQLEAMRTSLSESKLSQAKLRADCETAKERLVTARATIEALSSQVEGMRAMRQAQDDIIERHEKSLVEVHKELVNAYTRLAQNEDIVSRVQAELGRLRMSEGALRHECESLKKSTSTQQMVLQSAQELKACRLTVEAEQRLALTQRLDASEMCNKQLKQKLEEEEKRFVSELGQLQTTLDIERAALGQARAEIVRAEGETARLAERLAQAERDVLAMRAHRNPVTESEAQTDLLGRDEQAAAEHLGALQEEVAAQREALKRAHDETNKERVRAQTAEAKITDMEQILKKSQQDISQRNAFLATKTHEITQLRSNIANLEANLSDCRGEKNRLQLIFQNTKGELNRVQGLLQKQQQQQQQQQRMQQVSSSANPPAAPVPSVDTSAMQTLQDELALAKEHVQRLETQHKQDLVAISTFRKQALAATKSLEELKANLHETPQSSSVPENQKFQQEETEANNKKLLQDQERLALQEQNAALLDQVQTQVAELCALRAQLQQPGSTDAVTSTLNTSGSFNEEEANIPEQMLRVLRHLRREREVALSQVESLEAKVAGLQLQLETTQRQLQESKNVAAKSDQQSPSKNTMIELTQENYREMTQKLETLDALTDSNIIQRDKCTKLELQLTNLQSEVQSLVKVKEELTVIKEDHTKAVEKLKAQQVELVAVRGEAARWRSRANQLTERTNRANNEEIKRIQAERDSLQRQLTSDKEELQKVQATSMERETELNRVNIELTRINNEFSRVNGELSQVKNELSQVTDDLSNANGELTRVRDELSSANAEVTRLNEELTRVNAEFSETREKNKNEGEDILGKLTTFEQKFKELSEKELQVRRIARKYKTQYEELLKTVEQERANRQGDPAVEQQLKDRINLLETRIQELESSSAAADTREKERQSQLAQAEATAEELKKKLDEKVRESKSWEDRSERMKAVLQTAKQRINEANSNVNRLQQELNATNANLEVQRQAREEAEANFALINGRLVSQVASLEQQVQQLEQENAAQRNRIAEQLSQSAQQQQSPRQPTRYSQQGSSTVEKGTGETPTANIRPMAGANQTKMQQGQQSATVPPTSRGAPMARLRPMAMGPRSVAAKYNITQVFQEGVA